MAIDEPSAIVNYYISVIKDINTKLEELAKENEELKSEIKRLQWSLHEQD